MKLVPIIALAMMSLPARADFPPLGSNTAIEYYHAGFDHYFITALPAERAVLDAAELTGWSRTGRGFSVFSIPPPSPFTVSPVCRFYIPPQHGDSHFFSATLDECAAVRAKIGLDPN